VTWNDLTAKYLNSNFSKFLGRFSELKCGVTMIILFYSADDISMCTVFYSGTPVSATNKTDHHGITEILLNTITPNHTNTVQSVDH
jgi:hypothetical protein